MFGRKSSTQAKPLDLPAAVKGIRAFADQLDAGDPLALALLADGEMPFTGELWAEYPNGNWMP